MTARTAIVAGLVDLVRDTFTNMGGGQPPDAANGNTLPDPGADALSSSSRTGTASRTR